MCNLYSITQGPAAIRELAKAMRDLTGNFEPLPAVFPNRMAPVVRVAPDGVRELGMMRWRCLVPVTSFAEPDNNQGPRSIWTWFAQDESRPLMFFAGIWREWEGDRGTKTIPDVAKHLVFSFLTTDSSPDVAPIHPDATPVLLLDEDARETWMNAPIEEALFLQRPPPAGTLRIVATDTKQDGV